MSTPTLGDLRDGLKATLGAVLPELTVYQRVPDQVNLPCVIVVPGTAAFGFSKADPEDSWRLDLNVLVSRADVDLGQAALDPYVSSAGDKSLRAVIRRFPDLGIDDGNVRARITGMANYGGQFEAAGIAHIGATLGLLAVIRGIE